MLWVCRCGCAAPPHRHSPPQAHMDVVTANPESWAFDPFTFSREGDQLRGRGTTDCLGHVALLAELFKLLGQRRPKLKRTVVGVWIANEENSKVGGLQAGCAQQTVLAFARRALHALYITIHVLCNSRSMSRNLRCSCCRSWALAWMSW